MFRAIACLSVACAAGPATSGPNPQEAVAEFPRVSLHARAEPTYVLGKPMLVHCSLRNDGDYSVYMFSVSANSDFRTALIVEGGAEVPLTEKGRQELGFGENTGRRLTLDLGAGK